MKTYSIKTKITALFAILLAVLLALFIGVQIFYAFGEQGEFFHRVEHNAKILIEKATEAKQKGEVETTFDGVNIKFDKFLDYQEHIPPPPRFFEKDRKDDNRGPPRMFRELENGILVKPIQYNNRQALLIEKDDFKAVALDLRAQKSTILIWSLFGVVVLLITALYVFILKSLKPLKELQSSIEKFGKGSFQIELKVESNDEIGQIAKAFNEAATQVKYLMDSKDIFLKNAAHELRTPITKGLITVHLLPDNRDKEILINAFKRLETISESVISLERFASKEFALDLQPIMLKSIIFDAMELLFLEQDAIDFEFEDRPILADETLMSIAFKNLIDNGIKFSIDGRVRIEIIDGKVAFINKGEPLTEPIERHFDPFYKETSVRNARGSGLGLFLAKKIINAHGLKIDYRYINKEVIFYVG
ncbi:MAG: hypothetical protein RL154_405 [Pseudomonadota bacterium]